MCITKAFFFIVIILTFIKGYGCPGFHVGGVRSFSSRIRPVHPYYKPIVYKPIKIPEFKPMTIRDFKPIPEFKPPAIPKFRPIPSFPRDMNPSFKNLNRRSRLRHRQNNIGVGSSGPVEERRVPEAVASDTEDVRGKTKTTRRPYHRLMATKDPLSPALSPSIGLDRRLQKQAPNYNDYIKNISPQNRRLNFDIGYFYTPNYHYTIHDTGNTALGYSVKNKLKIWTKLSRFTTKNYPRFRYTVHHYYHDRDSVVEYQIIRPHNIVRCYGNSEMICPGNTRSLCTYDGTLMCVAIDTSTVPCDQGDCIKSTISCDDNPAPECENFTNITIDVPCISTVKVYGNIDYQNNIITANDHGTFAMTTEYSRTHHKFTTPKTESQKIQPSRNFCVGVVLSPTEL